MICLVVLQNCVVYADGETGSYSEACVMCDVDGIEEVYSKVEESTDIKSEVPEALIFPPIKTEQEVRLWGMCV
jgi:exopolysaccharide biosynthesis protein